MQIATCASQLEGTRLTEFFKLCKPLVNTPSQLCPLGELVLSAGLHKLFLCSEQLGFELALSCILDAHEHSAVETPSLQSNSGLDLKTCEKTTYKLEKDGFTDP